MASQYTCAYCGSNEDPYLDTVTVVHRPPDAYLGLVIVALINTGGGLVYSLTGMRTQYDFLIRIAAFIGSGFGVVYYFWRRTSATYELFFCPNCRKKHTSRQFNRIAIITSIVLISFGGAILVSAVMGSDDYIYVSVVLGGMIAVIALYFRLLSKPKFIAMGDEVSVINIPGLGHIRVTNSWTED